MANEGQRTRRSGIFNENYLYFANDGQNDSNKDAGMYAASRCLGMISHNSSKVKIFFEPRDGTGTTADNVLLTVGVNNLKKCMEDYVSAVNANRSNTNNFTVVADLNTNLPSNEGAVSATGIDNVTAVVITTH